MKLRNYLTEGIFKTAAFWISPKGEITGSLKKHIAMVISNPEVFGLTKDEIKSIYDSYGERIGQEGKARENIIRKIIFKKFIRIRKYDKYYTVNALMKNFLNKAYITKWAKLMLGPGVSGFKEYDPDFPVILTDLGKYHKETTIGKLSEGLFESIDVELIIKNDIKEFEPFSLDNTN